MSSRQGDEDDDDDGGVHENNEDDEDDVKTTGAKDATGGYKDNVPIPIFAGTA